MTAALPQAFIHPLADVAATSIGQGTRIWQYVVVLPDAVIGRDCNICALSFIENDVILGDRVTIKCGVYLWDGMRVDHDVFIGPNATFTNDKYPKSGVRGAAWPITTLQRGASVGAGAVVLPGITIGEGAIIGAGAVVTRDVAPGDVVVGNPARSIGER